MIHSQDRSGWFGASDTYILMCSGVDTKSFARWWAVKLGLFESSIATPAMIAGTNWEHRILEHMGIVQMDRQIRTRKYRLRVNLDGETERIVVEVKTHRADKPFRVSKAYWMQAQVERFAAGKDVIIAAYGLESEDYRNYFRPVDPLRLKEIPIPYDAAWIQMEYLPRLQYFADCLRRGIKPQKKAGERDGDRFTRFSAGFDV